MKYLRNFFLGVVSLSIYSSAAFAKEYQYEAYCYKHAKAEECEEEAIVHVRQSAMGYCDYFTADYHLRNESLNCEKRYGETSDVFIGRMKGGKEYLEEQRRIRRFLAESWGQEVKEEKNDPILSTVFCTLNFECREKRIKPDFRQ